MIKNLLLTSALLFAPLVGSSVVAEEPVTEEVVEVQDEEGNKYYIDFDKVDWSKVDIDWENFTTEQIAEALFSVAKQAMSPELLALCASVVSIAGVCIGLLIKAFKERAKASMTATECSEKVLSELNDVLVKLFQEKLTPEVKKLLDAGEIQNKQTEALLKASVLMTQNTPEAKEGLINILVKSGGIKQELAAESKAVIEKQVEDKKKHDKELVEEIDSLKTDDGTTI